MEKPSETSWYTLLIEANLVVGREHRHALTPVVVSVTTSPPTPTSRALIILDITKTESIKESHVFASSLVPQKIA